MAAVSSTHRPPPPSSAPRPPSPGDSARTESTSNLLAQSVAPSVDHQEAADPAPNDTYPSRNTAQMAQGGYYDPQAHHDFTREEELQMADTLQHGLQHNIAAHTDAAGSLNNGQPHSHMPGLVPAGALPQGMAPPPQTPHQASIGGAPVQRPSIDSATDTNYTGDNRPRKRSKVSRACDECRRKKVRCDSTAEDGSIKTCSNCARIQQTCSFSRVPMKRGPSKGYIKELSERVQQVESQILSGQGPTSGYRTSIDAGSPSAIYVDTSYSPSEGMSLKRTFSMSESRANPFAQPQFTNRDRMPSAGGWSVTSASQEHRQQDARGSIAIAPDQQLPDTDIIPNGPLGDLSKPFWAQDSFIEGRRQRKARLSEMGSDPEDVPLDINEDSLAPYYEFVAPMLPILPESIEATTKHIRASPAGLRHAFFYASSCAFGSTQLSMEHYASYRALEEYVWTEARQAPWFRSTSENLVWLWTYVFMTLNADNDLARCRGSENTLPQTRMIKIAIDLARFLLKELSDGDDLSTAKDLSDSPYTLARRAWNCICILARLYAVGTATEDDIPLDDRRGIGLAESGDLLGSDIALFLAGSSNVLSILTTLLQDDMQRSTRALSTKTRKLIQQHLDYVIISTPDSPAVAALVNSIRLFMNILLSRHTSIQHPIDILTPTISLAETISNDVTELPTKSTLKILDVHLFCLTTITLLEFTDVIDTDLSEPAWQTLAKVRHALVVVASAAQTRNQQRFGDGESDGMPILHWADGLLRMIDAKPRSDESNATVESDAPATDARTSDGPDGDSNAESNGVTAAAQQSNTTHLADMASTQGPGGDKVYDAKTGRLQMVDFSLLTSRGYLNVVAERNGV